MSNVSWLDVGIEWAQVDYKASFTKLHKSEEKLEVKPWVIPGCSTPMAFFSLRDRISPSKAAKLTGSVVTVIGC